jgi:DNA-directed RNA polymerase subunit RPC12/RpoP
MGYSISIGCKSCSYSKMLMVGSSFMEFEYPEVLEYIHPLARPKIEALDNSEKIQGSIHHKHFYQCKDCNHIFDAFVITVYDNEKKPHKVELLCEKCNSHVESLDEEDLGNCSCPECGNKTLYKDEDDIRVMWD